MDISCSIGIIDIGSNSIRLAIYEQRKNGAYRVISEFKESARLSGRIAADGSLPPSEIERLISTLMHFKRICLAHGVEKCRVAATAAIRNATNSQEIVDQLSRATGFPIEILSGEDEARIGFLGMAHTMDIPDGFLVDIGGGSTEVSLFREGKRLRSMSFPFGAVNTTRKFAPNGEFQEEQLRSIRAMAEQAFAQEPWIKEASGLPLVGLGGAIRTLCKINQRKKKYSLQTTHNYIISAADMDELVHWLTKLSGEKRKKVDGLAKDRHDIIVPGLLILHTLFQATGAKHYVVSGAGLRDGLFFESFEQTDAAEANRPVAERSVDNLLALHSTAPPAHSAFVCETALMLYDAAANAGLHKYDSRIRLCLQTAAKLYRIGASINYYQYAKHSFHMIANTRIDGLSHREILLAAFIATFKTKPRTKQQYVPYKDILQESDVDLIARLGFLLRLSIALDISETQPFELTRVVSEGGSLQLQLQTKHDPSAECREVEGLLKEFKKAWGIPIQTQVTLLEPTLSTN
ncbi:Ppx/GppA family phosphatase [Paenibacillus cremeus]|uniref:Ppx/GppA family phosphatase n=1 Tax=Paenibacillus cremeus TaxID=2163881 RepID=A0A559K5M6_9BACL|nr:Ppx/GppA family phosphatase [Paenibacillus cremeus]TVY07432.1 Ppx/GppA family phosphatase [Paenibacillus cremeus]